MAIPTRGGKHVVIAASCIVHLAISDAKYNFTLVDVGQYGSNNDRGVLAQSKISSGFENNTLNLPESKVLPGKKVDIPYFLVGDEIFPLKPWLLCPHPGMLLQLLEMIYNYRHSRIRRKDNGGHRPGKMVP